MVIEIRPTGNKDLTRSFTDVRQHDEWDDGYSHAAFGDTEHDVGN